MFIIILKYLQKKVKDEEDAVLEASMFSNGHITITLPEIREKEDNQYIDRRISNMLTFKPDLSKITEADVESNKSADIERIIALEVAEIVNRKSRLKKEKDELINIEDKLDISSVNNEEEKIANEESHLNNDCQKSTQTDPYKSPANTLRRKSIQIVNKIFIKDGGNKINLEDMKMDDQNSEGDCKASPLDVFRYPNLRKKFLILTFDWVALGVIYNGLSYNTPNLGVDDYLAFFIGK